MSGAISNNLFQTMSLQFRGPSGAPSEMKVALLPANEGHDIFQSVDAPATRNTAPTPATSAASGPPTSPQSLAQTGADSALSAGTSGSPGLALILLGIPDGAKKGLAEKLAATYNVPHVSVGQLVTSEIASGSQLGMLMQKARDTGAAPSGAQVGDLIARRLEQDDCRRGFVLDAFSQDLDGTALTKLTESNDNLKAIALESLPGQYDQVPALQELKKRGDLYTAPDTGNAESDGQYLDAITANFLAPDNQELGLFK